VKKIYYTWDNIQGAVLEIARQMNEDNWKPDYIVGITRGGLIPANLLSQYTGVKMHTLNVSLRDSEQGPESNCWMSEDAFGFNAAEKEGDPLCKNILIVDDINDSGATIAWIKQDWESTCLPNDPRWSHVWGGNVKFAVITDNMSSKEFVDYSVYEVNKAEEDCWLVYPWEEFWK
jgi:hypoxanthine phosphoribosyltransferase